MPTAQYFQTVEMWRLAHSTPLLLNTLGELLHFSKISFLAVCTVVSVLLFDIIDSLFSPRRNRFKKKLGSELQVFSISWNIDSERSVSMKMCLARCVKDTLNNYFASADKNIDLKHVVNSSVSD